MRLIAHRGDAAHQPENTMAAFRAAVERGADMIELDVQLSRDGRLVVIHDQSLERTTTGRGPVADHTLAELRRLDAGRGERIPTLEEVLALPIPLDVEVKAAGAVARVVSLVAGREDVLLSSFDLGALEDARRRAGGPRLAYLCRERDWSSVLERACAGGAYALNPPREALTPALVERAHAAGLKVMTYTVNEPAEAGLLFGWGVDALFTDDPARLLPVLGRQPADILGSCAEVAE